jgi:hypothetical protein
MAAEHEDSEQLIPKSVIVHDPEQFSFTPDPDNLFSQDVS